MPVMQRDFASATHDSAAHKQVAVKKGIHQKRVATKRKAGDIVLVVNPNSRSGLTGKDWGSLFVKIKEVLGKNLEVAFTKKSGEGTVLTRDFLRRGIMPNYCYLQYKAP
jgi:hypothetical protein